MYDTIYKQGMWFWTNKPTIFLDNHIREHELRGYRTTIVQGMTRVLLRNTILLSIKDLRCQVHVGCYLRGQIVYNVNNFLEELGIEYIIYLSGKQPRIKGEKQFIF